MMKKIICLVMIFCISLFILGCSSEKDSKKFQEGEMPRNFTDKNPSNFEMGSERSENFEGGARKPEESEGFEISSEKQEEIKEFFETKALSELKSYCKSNNKDCLFYCIEINPEHEICSTLNRGPER